MITLSSVVAYIGAESEQLIENPLSTSRTAFLSVLFIMIFPSLILPLSRYVPADDIVRTVPWAEAPDPFTVNPLSDAETVVQLLSHSYVRSFSEYSTV